MANQAIGSRRLDRLLAEYGDSHQNATNKRIHWIAVPVIAWTVLALLWALPVPRVFEAVPYLNWATIVAALAVVYYVGLSWPLAVGMIVFVALSVWLIGLVTAHVPLPLWVVALGLFAIAWVFQFIGHDIEGKRPSFLKDIQFLLIGPAWLMHFIYRRLGIPY